MRGLVISVLFFVSINASAANSEDNFWGNIKNQIFETYESTMEYISPRADIVKFYWSHQFKAKVQPKIIKGYSLYYKHVGSDLSDYVLESYNEHLKPKLDETFVSTIDYYETHHSITFRYLTDIPAFIKIGYEGFIFQIWKNLDRIKGHEAVEKHKPALGIADAAVKAKASNKYRVENRYLNDLLNEIKYHSYDYGMQDCYKAYIVELDFVNAFNTGCSVFITTTLYDEFKNDPDALRAIMAHEIAHGDRGHSLKTLGQFLKSGGQHFGQFGMEWLLWLVTGKKHEFYKQVDEQTHMSMVMHQFSEKAPAIELDADIVGAEILIKAGFSKQDLKRALVKLHRADPSNIQCDREKLEGTSRDYPSLCIRLNAIDAVR